MTAADLARLDVPVATVEAQAAAAPLRRAIAREAALHDDYEVSALSESLLLVTHPDIAVSTDADYAGTPWAASLAARQAECRATRKARQNQQPGGAA